MSFAINSKSVSTFGMDTVRLTASDRPIYVFTNANCSVLDVLPDAVSVAVSPLLSWTIMVSLTEFYTFNIVFEPVDKEESFHTRLSTK